MRAYFIRRLLLVPPTLLGVAFLVFVVTRLTPGGPLEQRLAEMRHASADGGSKGVAMGQKQALSEEQIQQLKEFYDLDDENYPRAFLKYLGLWPKAEGRKKVELPLGKASLQTLTALTRERVEISRDAQGNLSVTRPGGASAAPWKVRSLGQKDVPAAKEGEPAAKVERVEIYQSKFTGVLTGNLGRSIRYQDSVGSMIRERLPVTTYLGLMTLLLSYLISIPLGVMKAVRHNTWFDNLTSAVVFIGFAIPAYALASVLVAWLGVKLDWFPAVGFTSYDFADRSAFGKALDIAHHTLLPLFCYALGSFAFLAMMMKNQLMDNLSSDYVRTAVAKGLPFGLAIRRHAFRNALIPIATRLGAITSIFVGGSFLLERVFDINGIGLLFFESAIDRDFPVFMGIMLFSALLIMLGNILSDFLVVLVDPRVKFD